jgi:hypothetical protein
MWNLKDLIYLPTNYLPPMYGKLDKSRLMFSEFATLVSDILNSDIYRKHNGNTSLYHFLHTKLYLIIDF